VLCEKPIALSLEDADRMIRASAENKVKLMIAHSRRFIPRYSIVREMIGQGRVGKPIWLTQISRRTVVDPSSWYFNPEMTLGPIAEVGVHDADLLRWMLRDDVVEVRGIARSREENTRVYDQIFAALKFRRGTIASFEVGYVLPKGYPQYTTLEVLGSQGLISASDRHMNVATQGTEGGVAYPLAYSDLLSVNSAYEREILAFIESVVNDTTSPVTGAEARAALEIILTMLQSIQTKKPIRLRPRMAN
jgi:predicted dehydrogenase